MPKDTAASLWRWLPLLWSFAAAALSGWLIFDPSTGLFGAFGAILLLCTIGILAVGPLLSLLRALVYRPGASRWFAGRLHLLLGVRDLLRHPADLSAALAALVLAVATSVGIATMVDSFRSDFEAMLAQRLQADLTLDGAPGRLAAAAQSFAQDRSLQGRLQPRYEARSTLAGEPVEVRLEPFDERFAAAYRLAGVPPETGVLVNERAARRFALAIGDPITLLDRQGTVAGVFPGYGDAGLKLIMALAPAPDGVLSAERQLGEHLLVLEQLRVYLTVGDPIPIAAAMENAFPELAVGEREAVRRRALAVFDQTFAITRSLTLLSLGVAAIGLYSALVAIGLLQAPTQRLLQFLGQSRSEHFGFLFGRSLAVSLLTFVLAVPLGLLLAALLCQVVNPRGFGWSVPVAWSLPAVLLPLLVAAGAALAAGLLSGGRQRAAV